MIALAHRTSAPRSRRPDWHNRFLDMLPTIRRYARGAFRDFPPASREQLVDDVVADTLVAYRRLIDQGREALAYPTVLARYGVAHVRQGRLVGVKQNCRDVLSEYAQRHKQLHIDRLDQVDDATGDWREVAVEDRRSRPAEIAAFRIDFAAWLRSLPSRDRRIARALASGESTSRAAQRFRVSAARISQLRNELHDAWQRFQGEAADTQLAVA